MTDGIIKGNGNSRYLKTVADALTLYPTYEDFITALVAGTLPIDLNGINAEGWSQLGTALNKANLLADTTASKFGLGAAAVPNDVFNAIGGLPIPVAKGGTGVTNLAALATALGGAKIKTGSYSGTGATSVTINPGFPVKAVLVSFESGGAFIGVNGGVGSYFDGYPYICPLSASAAGNGITWTNLGYGYAGPGYSGSGDGTPDGAMNASGKSYKWVAFG